MKIIGHRGAAGHAPENTLPSLKAALELGVDAIEIDVRKTKDGRLVLSHDADLDRLARNSLHIGRTPYEDLRHIALPQDTRIISLERALRLVGPTPVIIELKSPGAVQELVALLERFPRCNVWVASFNHAALLRLKKLNPQLKLVALERTNPIEVVQTARHAGFTGIGTNYWIMNPLTYWLARRAGLQIYVYTVNNLFIARFLRALYPHIDICTDYPDRLKALAGNRNPIAPSH